MNHLLPPTYSLFVTIFDVEEFSLVPLVFRFADQSGNGSFGIYLLRVKFNAEGHGK